MRMRNELGSLAAVIDISAPLALLSHNPQIVPHFATKWTQRERRGGEKGRAAVFRVRKTANTMGNEVRIADD